MSIPPFNGSGLLPPYVGTDPAVEAGCSPYLVTIVDVVSRFATSPERTALLDGLLRLRTDMSTLGLSAGFQWLDGSFVEHIDNYRAPNDIDVVTFLYPPAHLRDPKDLAAATRQYPHIFQPRAAKATYKCDHYFVNLTLDGSSVVAQTRYWFGLFSHRRRDLQWKGMLQVPLGTVADDAHAASILGGGSP